VDLPPNASFGPVAEPGPARLRRLAEEIEESGLRLDLSDVVGRILLEEIDQALRPPVHERRIASCGTIIEPSSDPSLWASGTELVITRGDLGEQLSRRHADLPTDSRAGSCAARTTTTSGSCSTAQRGLNGTLS